ncbi:DUF7553 family protein [Halomarina litorea]|uniref:DUF7553 family protein n=1 Tax=Halomarina litorea TaxID=2961595 RepID=UPI0020C54567|nr:hypothetical protein [Halomarina sp. BCD28]
MNKHFEDAQYYLRRAGSTVRKGVREELDPIQRRVQGMVGGEDPEPSRVDQFRSDLKEIQGRAEGEAREAIGVARGRLGEYRPRRAAK